MNDLRLAGGDTMNYWIKDFREELLATIREWDFLLINDSEARMLSGESNLRKAASAILDMGPHTLVIKRGEYGAMLFRRDSFFIVPGYLLEDVFDPTGAGDCFAGGFIGYLAEQGFDLKPDHIGRGDLSRAVIYGSVMGSFCCERFGVERFRTLTRAEIDARFRRVPQVHVVLSAHCACSACRSRCSPSISVDRGMVVPRARLRAVLRRRRSASEHRPPHSRFAHARPGADRHRLAAACRTC